MNAPIRSSSGDSPCGDRPNLFSGAVHRRDLGIVFVACLFFFTLTNYGGIRSPDNEVVFRAALSFADHGRLDVSRGLEDWPGFGVARARDGRDYPVFGPVQSIVLAPFVVLGRALLPDAWSPSTRLPISFYAPGGLASALYGAPQRDFGAHALRLFCSFVNLLAGALAVAVFFATLRRLGVSRSSSFLTAAFLAVGSPLWPYSGTFFSETLALLLLLLSFQGTLDFLPGRRDEPSPAAGAACRAGLSLGLAVSTHLSAALFLPFFAVWPALAARRGKRPGDVRAARAYFAGLATVLLALALYNLARFGNPFETGRTVSAEAAYAFGYGTWTAPWPGIYGLLLSPGKGLLLFCPGVLLGMIAWPSFHRRYRALSLTLATAALLRIFVLACRSDWHGGFCLGPRYLLLIIPFLLLPIGPALDAWWRPGRRWLLPAVGLVLALCASQQFSFCLGEIFRWYHHLRMRAEAAGVDVFTGDRIYLDGRYSPLVSLLSGARGPFLLQGLGIDNAGLWGIASLLCATLIALAIVVGQRCRSSQPG